MKHAASQQSHWVRASVWLSGHWPHLLDWLGTSLIVVIGLFKVPEPGGQPWLIVGLMLGALLLSLVGKLHVWNLTGNIAKLRAERSALEDLVQQVHQDYETLFQYELYLFAVGHNFSDTERISVYKHDGRAFVMLSRYSKDPEFTKKGRGIYPDDEGCIGVAWREGESFVDNLPDPDRHGVAYYHRLKQDWRINKTTAQRFRMRSRSYAAFAIDEPLGMRRVAIVVFESTRPGAFDPACLRQALRDAEGQRIAQFIEKMQPLEPSPSYAAREGF